MSGCKDGVGGDNILIIKKQLTEVQAAGSSAGSDDPGSKRRRRANGDLWGCLRLTRKSGGIDGSEEIIGGVGAGSVFEADVVVDEVGADAGVR